MSQQAFCHMVGSPGPREARQHRMTSTAVLNRLLMDTVNIKVISDDLKSHFGETAF